MKTSFTFLLLFITASLFGKNTTYDHLAGVNRYWADHKNDVAFPVIKDNLPDRGWIRLHLSLVEDVLRRADVSGLTASQQHNRSEALDHLHQYWHEGRFPINDKYAVRTPIFIDDYNNFCAVGYLVKATGHEDISRMIAAKTNLAYVKEMDYPELNRWADEFGFTVNELAWIQPGYGPTVGCGTVAVGKGTDGIVHALYPSGDTLYVGGTFTSVDDSISAGNIGYLVAENNAYSWHTMGQGFDGTVNAIVSFQGKIYAGGSFTNADGNPVSNIAVWDGAEWQSAGCIYGTVKDLIVFDNDLYAAGDFDVCAAMSEVNIAKLGENNVWSQMGHIEGHVNTMEVYKGALYLGGDFSFQNEQVNVLKYTVSGGYQAFTSPIKNEVMDFGVYNDTLTAVCRKTSSVDSDLVQLLINNDWVGLENLKMGNLSQTEGNSFNTFCVYENEAFVGGYIQSYEMMGAVFQNCINLYNVPEGGFSGGEMHKGNWFMVDSTINKMVVFNNELFVGGAFKTGANYPVGADDEPLNGIARKTRFGEVGVREVENKFRDLTIYPNPVASGNTVNITSSVEIARVELSNIEGRVVETFILQPGTSQIELPTVAAGAYILVISDKYGQKTGRILTIK